MESGDISKKDTYFDNGLSLQNITDEVRYKNQIPGDIKGVLITDVKEDSSASIAGFEPGDIIVQINQKIINSVDDYIKEIKSSKNQNSKLMIWINRKGVLMGLVLK